LPSISPELYFKPGQLITAPERLIINRVSRFGTKVETYSGASAMMVIELNSKPEAAR